MNCNYGETNCEVFQADDQTKLLAHSWLPQNNIKAVFLAIHGGMAHGGDWVTPALYFKEKGIATYALDLRWHGTYAQHNKGGKNFCHVNSYEETLRDIDKFYTWIKEKHPNTPMFIIAHSVGGLNALHYGLTIGKDRDIKGYILSSPWLKNVVVFPKVLKALTKILVKIVPNMAVKPESLTDVLTHDEKITARHHADEAAGIRGTSGSVKFVIESEKTQAWVIDNLKFWKKYPMFVVLAGQDRLADNDLGENALKVIPGGLVTLVKCKDNYHENFNETNRNEIFAKAYDWMQKCTKF
ncbi:MAG: alpha/beta fold hydrolase [Chrysiogenales bacterium]|nr:MAG: alpha/beta fold hydrolase [Chrysiogenales bacterium]